MVKAARKVKRSQVQSKEPQQQEEKDLDTQAFLHEVDEAMHEEKIMNFWQKYRAFIIGGIVALFVIVGGKELYISSVQSQKEHMADLWFEYQNTGDKALLEEIQRKGSSGFKALAHFAAAREAQSQGETATAIGFYENVYNNSSLTTEIRDLAKLYAGMALMEVEANIPRAIAFFDGLIKSNSIFQPTALEFKAHAALNIDDVSTALNAYERLTTLSGVPPSLAQRAQEQIDLIKTTRGVQ